MSTNEGAVKNKNIADKQITAEQIIRESLDKANEIQSISSHHDMKDLEIKDEGELKKYLHEKRKGFEDNLRRQRHNMGVWTKYAKWEETIGDLNRCRSVYERALNVDYTNTSIWLKYIDMEIRHGQVKHGLNIFQRVNDLLPRFEQFWLKHCLLLESCGEFDECRNVFKKWLVNNSVIGPYSGYLQWFKFEKRLGEDIRAKNVLIDYINNSSVNFSGNYDQLMIDDESMGEAINNDSVVSRAILNRQIEDSVIGSNLVNAYITLIKYSFYDLSEVEGSMDFIKSCSENINAKFLTPEFFELWTRILILTRLKNVKQINPTDVTEIEDVYKTGLKTCPKSQELLNSFSAFLKEFGSRQEIDDFILLNKIFDFEKRMSTDMPPICLINLFISYANVMYSSNDMDKLVEVFERGIARILEKMKSFYHDNEELCHNQDYWSCRKRFAYFLCLYIKYFPNKRRDIIDFSIKIFNNEYIHKCLILEMEKIDRSKAFAIGNATRQNFKRKRININSDLDEELSESVIYGSDTLFTEWIKYEHSIGNLEKCRTLVQNRIDQQS